MGKNKEIKESLASASAEKISKAERDEEKLLIWPGKRLSAQILDWFDCVEEKTVVGNAGEILWRTETVERNRYFRSLLGMKI